MMDPVDEFFELRARREFKYAITEEVAEQVRRAIQPFCRRDRASAQADGGYWIQSLYLDSPTLELYQANVREQAERFKLRVRSYPGTGTDFVFLEVKNRSKDAISKNRVAVPSAIWRALLHDPWKRTPSVPKNARHFLGLTDRLAAQPQVLVRYRREAWQSEVDFYGRVTFDREITAQIQQEYSLCADELRWRALDTPKIIGNSRSLVVLELKFERAPRWMRNLVQTFELERASFSKYYRAVQALGVTPRQSMGSFHVWR